MRMRALTNGPAMSRPSFLLRPLYDEPRRCRGSTCLPPTASFFERRVRRSPGGLSCDRMRGHARACVWRASLSRDSTCKSGRRTDLKRARTYRRWLNSRGSISDRLARRILHGTNTKPWLSITFTFYFVWFHSERNDTCWRTRDAGCFIEVRIYCCRKAIVMFNGDETRHEAGRNVCCVDEYAIEGETNER